MRPRKRNFFNLARHHGSVSPACRRCRPTVRPSVRLSACMRVCVYVWMSVGVCLCAGIVNRTLCAADRTARPICCRSINGGRTTYNAGRKPFRFVPLFAAPSPRLSTPHGRFSRFARFLYIYLRNDLYKDDGSEFPCGSGGCADDS